MQVAYLFQQHADLLSEFTKFLPDTSVTASAVQPSLARQSFHRFDERISAMPNLRPSHLDKVFIHFTCFLNYFIGIICFLIVNVLCSSVFDGNESLCLMESVVIVLSELM